MELNTENRIFSVLHSHDFIFSGHGCYFQALRYGCRVGSERMIAGNREGVRAFEKQKAIRVKCHLRLFPVHQSFGVRDRRAKCCTYSLMAQADSQYGNLTAKLLHNINYNTGIFRSAGTGREDYAVRFLVADFFDCHLIVADDANVSVDFPDQLIEVIRKAVVIIYKKDHGMSPVFISLSVVTVGMCM